MLGQLHPQAGPPIATSLMGNFDGSLKSMKAVRFGCQMKRQTAKTSCSTSDTVLSVKDGHFRALLDRVNARLWESTRAHDVRELPEVVSASPLTSVSGICVTCGIEVRATVQLPIYMCLAELKVEGISAFQGSSDVRVNKSHTIRALGPHLMLIHFLI